MSQMIAIGILFCLIFVNCFGGIDGVGEEANNGNGKKDLLFEEMWRKAFEANRHNGKEGEEKEMAKEVEEKDEEEKTVKKEPIDDQLKEGEKEDGIDGKKWQKVIKMEPKIEEKEWGDLMGKEHTEKSDQNKLVRKKNLRKPKSEEEKWEIIEQFDKMRKEYKMKRRYKREDRNKIEEKIAKELGTCRTKIYRWKKELIQWKDPESGEEKWEIIGRFDKMRKANRNKYKNESHAQIERGIAKELGKSRAKIYAWKKELMNSEKKLKSEEERWEIIERFDKLRKEYKMKKGYKSEDRNKIEEKIAKKLGTYRNKIYEWKREMKPPKKQIENKEEKREMIEKFEKMRKEYKIKKDYKSEDRNKIENKIAKELGTCRTKIYRWKKELNQRKEPESEEEKWEIIEKFDKMRKANRNKYKNESHAQIERGIAKELGKSRAKIYAWKKELMNSEKKLKSEEERWEIIERFDKMRKEYKMKGDYKREDRNKIEEKIAKKLGTCRTKIYRWKKELIQWKESAAEQSPLRVIYTEEQKRAIIAKFDDLCEEFSKKFNKKPTKKIEEKIAKKFDICRMTIYMWKKAFEKDEA